MKRKLIASILGVGAAVTLAHAQGHVYLNNYSFNPYGSSSYYGDPVLYGAGSGGTAGAKVTASSGFNLELAYDIGTVSGTAATGQTGGNGALDAGFTETGTLGLIGGGNLPGYYTGGTVSIAGYTSGPITFEFLAFNGSDYADSTIRGHSEAVTMASIDAPPSILTTQVSGFSQNGFYVTTVPEPATMALMGLGAAGLMYFRRRKA